MSNIKFPTKTGHFTKTVHNDVYSKISPLEGLKDTAKGLTVFVTGAGRGIGRSIALTFAQAGAKKVIITARSAEQLDEVEQAIKSDPHANGTEVAKFVQDVLDSDGTEKIFATVGDVDVLINNAGYLENWLKIGETTPDDWFKTWEVNVKGTFIPTRAFLRQIEATKRTKPVTIINTSSAGSINTAPGASSYQATKSAVNRFTEYLHYEYPETVRTFAYHPGGVVTQLAKGMPTFMHGILNDQPELAAGYTLWLSTQPEAEFLRGKYSSCTWDIDELVAKKDEILEKNLLWTVVIGQEQIRN
ncbi:putative oxidoreductase [Meredithblackwellia eburnea MCA 4105]